MELIGYVIIVFSIFGILINGRSFMIMYKIKKGASTEMNTSESKQRDSWFSSLTEYELGGLAFSTGALLIGFYIAINGVSLVQLAGFVLLLLSLGGFVQSFKKSETQHMLYQAQDYETSANQMASRLRIIALIELCLAIYLLA